MRLSHRIMLLCCFGAAGLGFAIGTALTLDEPSGPIPTVALEQVDDLEPVGQGHGPAGPAPAAPCEPAAGPATKPETPRVAGSPAPKPDSTASTRASGAAQARPIEPPAVERPAERLFRSVRVAVGTGHSPSRKSVDSRTEQESPQADPTATRAYRPQNLTPAELQRLVEPLLTEGVGTASVSPSIEVGDRSAGREGAGSGTGTVVVVRDHPAVLDQIDRVVAQLDVPPPQLRIQALVLTVPLKNSDLQGIDFDFLRQRKHLRSPPDSAADAAPGLPAALVAEPSGLKCGVLEGSVTSLLDTLDAVGPTQLAAVPAVTADQGSPVEIPLAVTAGGRDEAAGERGFRPDSPDSLPIRLLLRWLASVEGSIRLELEIPPGDDDLVPGGADSSGVSRPGAGRDALATTLVVPDAATIVLGGIIRRVPKAAADGTPIPDRFSTLRRRARTSAEKREKSWGWETLVLLNPHVVSQTDPDREPAAGALLPEARRSIARRYFLAARQALAGGDRQQALHLLEAALRFDPLEPQAIEARNQLWLARTPGGDDAENLHLAARAARDGQAGRLP